MFRQSEESHNIPHVNQKVGILKGSDASDKSLCLVFLKS